MTRTLLLVMVALASRASEHLEVPLGLDGYLPAPPDNPIRREVVRLGRELFHDKRLSRDRSTSCATCHDPSRAFTDGRRLAVGVFNRVGQRRTPALINRVYGKTFFWDGRSASLEDQVVQPILHSNEMDLSIKEALSRLVEEPSYSARFRDAFNEDVSEPALRKALASYVRSILAGDSPFDRYMAGDKNALSEEVLLGLRVFRGKGNCIACHVGPNLTDEKFHNTGSAWQDGKLADIGRSEWSRKDDERGAFKTPTLREVARTGPYMHNGSVAALDDVIKFYDEGGRANPSLDSEMRPLNLTQPEKAALVLFLKSLTGVVREGW